MASNNNRIEPQDIINEDDIISSLKNIKDGLKELKEAIQGVAESQKVELKNIISTAGMEKASDRVNALVQALAALNTAYQQNENALRDVTQAQLRQTAADKNVAEARLANARAYTEENKAMSRRSSASRQQISDIETEENARRLLDGTIKTNELSYNQLYAVYKKLSGQLKNMSADMIADNKNLATVTKQVRDSMNEAMKAMGNYSLNVGKYHTAFDGLGYSIQQVMREVPSAINISQFFLAISNNIPMVVDQMKLFNQEQANIKKQMADLNEGTKEYIELQKQQMSLGKKVLSSIFSWQTALLGLLLLLRKSDKIIDGIKNLWHKMKDGIVAVNNEISIGVNKAKTYSSALASVSKSYVELGMLVNQIQNAVKGTDEWKSAIERVNEITGSTLDSTTATVDAVKKVTEEYKKQAMQIAINNQIVDSLASDMVNKSKRSRIFNNTNLSAESVVNTLGLTDEKQITEVTNAYNKYKSALDKVTELRAKLRQYEKTGTEVQVNAIKNSLNSKSGWESVLKDATTEYQNAVKKYAPINDKATIDWMNSLYQGIPNGKGNKSKKAKATKEDDPANRRFEAMEAMLSSQSDSYQKEIALAKVAYEKALSEEETFYIGEQEKAKGNNEELQRLKREHDQIVFGINQEYITKSDEIWEKWEKKRIEEEIADSNAVIKETKRRVKTREDEVRNNEILASNIAQLNREKARLEAIDTSGIEEEEKKKEEAINKVTRAIEKQKNALKFDQQLKNYKNFWDMIGANGALEGVGGDDKKGFLQKLGIVGVTDDNAESVFDQWVTNASSALKDMSSELKSYLSDMLSSWSSFYEERAELAKADTDEAKSYWEQQKELQKEGYANEVDTAWATYQEKLKYQQQAEALSKQWASVSQYVSDVEAGANLAVAVSNLLKQFTAIPGVGLALGAGAVAALLKMWGTYKSQVKSVATYGEGGYEALVGGSHASGHDIDMGFNNKSGRRVHTEGGEGWAVFSRRAVGKYGHKVLGDMVSRANAGTLAIGALQGNERMNEGGMVMSGVSLEKIERLLGEIEKNGSSNTMVMADGTVVTRTGNSTKRIRR